MGPKSLAYCASKSLDSYTNSIDILEINSQKLSNGIKRISEYSSNYDYNKSVEGNGYRSFVKMIEKFLKLKDQVVSKQDVYGIRRMVKMSNFLIKLLHFVEAIHEETLHSDEPMSLFCHSESLFFNLFQCVGKNEGELEVFFSEFQSFWLSPSYRTAFRLYTYLIVLVKCGIHGLLTDGVEKCFREFSLNSSPKLIRYIWSLQIPFSEYFYTELCPLICYGLKPEMLMDFEVSRQNSWILQPNGSLCYNLNSNETFKHQVDRTSTIKLRFLQSQRNNGQKCKRNLVFQIHGAGFLAQNPKIQDVSS